MIPWELFSYRLFKTVIFLMLLLCCLVPVINSRPLEVETAEDWNSKEERLENKPKIKSSTRVETENQEFGSKTANKNTSMVVRVIVSSSSSSSSDFEGEFSGFPAFQFISSSTTGKPYSSSTSRVAIKTTTPPEQRPEINRSVIGGRGQNSRYFLRPKRISTFTAKTATSTPKATTTTTTTTVKTDLSATSVSIEEENQERDSEKLVKTKKRSEDIFSAFYRVFSKSTAGNRSSSSQTERVSVREKDESLNDNDNSPVMSDSQNVERFQVYPQLIRSRIELAYNSNRKSSNNRKTLAVDSNNNNKTESLDGRGFGPDAKVVSVVTHTKSVAVNTHRSSKHVITNSRPLPVRARPIYQPKPAETAIEAVSVATLKNSSAPRKSGLSPIITSNSSPRSSNVSPIAQALIQDSPIYNPIAYTRITTNTPTSTTQKTTTPKITSTTQKSTTVNWHQPEKIWGEPAQIWGSPGKIWGEPEKVWGEPAKVWSEPAQPSWLQPEPSLRFRGSTSTESTLIPSTSTTLNSFPDTEKSNKAVASFEDEEDEEEKNSKGLFFQLGEDEDEEMENEGGKNSWELPELSPQVDHTFVAGRVSVPSLNNNNNNKPTTNTYTNNNNKHSISTSNNNNNNNENSRRSPTTSTSVNKNTNSRDTSSAVDAEKEKSGKKFGYVLEGADVRKYRVEERTPDGYIVGEYGVLNNENGFLRGVRYTADGTINPRLIHEALMKFLAL